jgi:uncharacterized protein (DUF4213/DUF364 family)
LDLIAATLAKLHTLYVARRLKPGRLESIAVKPQWTVVLGTGDDQGIAMNFTGKHAIYGRQSIPAKALNAYLGRGLFECAAEGIASRNLSVRAMGFAALGALSRRFLSPEALVERGFASQPGFAPLADWVRPSDRMAMVGYGGIIRPVLRKLARLDITEIRPPTAFRTVVLGAEKQRQPKLVRVYPQSANRTVLGKADVVAITGSALVNGTFPELLGFCPRARVRGAYGPSISFIPDVLFELGLDYVINFYIEDPERFAFDAVHDTDMEAALKAHQRQQFISRQARP